MSSTLTDQILIRHHYISEAYLYKIGNNDFDYDSYPTFKIDGYTMTLAIGCAYTGYVNCTNLTPTRVNYEAKGEVVNPLSAICFYVKNK